MTYPTQEELEAMARAESDDIGSAFIFNSDPECTWSIHTFARRLIDWHTEQLAKQEPIAYMFECKTVSGYTTWILSWSKTGEGVCNWLPGEQHRKPLYAHPVTAAPKD